MSRKIRRLYDVYRNIFSWIMNPSAFRVMTPSFSQCGEDMLLRLNFSKEYIGFYVDVGAYNPLRISNTKYFYDRGWSGINIDAMPGSMDSFNAQRKRDINICCGIGPESGQMDFYVFNDKGQNTFSATTAQTRNGTAGRHIEKKIPVPVLTLTDALDKYLPIGQKIDFLDVDVEGLDLEVLQSNDWGKYRPSFVVCEKFGTNIIEIGIDPFVIYMTSIKYKVIMVTSCSMIFEDILNARTE